MTKRAKTTTKPATSVKNFRRQNMSFWSQMAAVTKQTKFGRIYLLTALLILLTTVIFWSLLGAHVQQANADQLINAYLFEHNGTFQQALIPATHSFLLKWPVFMLIALMGFSTLAFYTLTVICVVITVACLVIVMALIERRPLVLGTLCLALASVLLLVPTQPHVGALLPVNMAMLTTRNLEYALYISCLALLAWRPRFKSQWFWLSIAGLTVLIASDKLFLALTLGGSLLALVAYSLANGWNVVELSVKWLTGSLLAIVFAGSLVWLVGVNHLTTIVNPTQTTPYAVIQGAHDLVLGISYAAVGLLTNLGANPAFDTTVYKEMPASAIHHLLSLSGAAFIINLLIALGGMYAMFSLLRHSFMHNKKNRSNFGLANRLVILLTWSSLASIVLFISSSHYYAGDARYLTIWLFAIFVALATFVRGRRWQPERLVIVGSIVSLSIIAALPMVVQTYHSDISAQKPFTSRNITLNQALAQHPVDVLVGDYWRVLPIKATANRLNVLPLSGCTQPRNILTSKAWQLDLKTHSFAYLLTLDGSPADFPSCSLQQVTNVYGSPNASLVIAGGLSHPREMLLFYDHGIHLSSSATPTPPQGPSTVVPISLDDLPHTTCPVPTVMQVVAHEDDDLLFMNPDLIHDIHAGHCMRTVYMTAGDAGQDQFYWHSRERGSENAYSTMLGLGTDQIWIERVVKLAGGQYITVANPRGNNTTSLIFMHLPDGNMKGQGFSVSHFESLTSLLADRLTRLDTVYSGSSYTSPQLVNALSDLLHTYQPAEIRTQSNFAGSQYTDHSDHMAVGRFVQQAYGQYEKQQYDGRVMVPLHFYMGYPVHQRPVNVSSEDLAAKQAAFLAYAHFDNGVCNNAWACAQNPAYGNYLTRQYQNSY